MALTNNATRIIVSIIAIPGILAVSYFGDIYFFLFVCVIALASFYEFGGLAKQKGADINFVTGVIGVLFLLINSYNNFIELHSFLLFYLVLLTLVELFRNKESAIINTGVTLIVVLYVGLFSGAIIEIRELYPDIGTLYYRGGYLIISILASIWICDSAAYWGGTALGKHKLFPRVSPNKSWEGAIFGFAFAIIAMILAKYIALDFLNLSSAIAIGFITGSIGQIGDLIESLFKRDAGVKDSSGLIPGHGGIFDRFDSLLYSAPVILLYLKHISR